MDNNISFQEVELNYRKLYGKLYASLIGIFGVQHTMIVEDAIQNSFYKSLKTWKPNHLPNDPLNWFFIVCKNDIVSQLGKQSKALGAHLDMTTSTTEVAAGQIDLRLETLLLIANVEQISVKSKILFSLKNIFGLSVREIHQCTLLNEDAIYKNVKRTQSKIVNQPRLNFPVKFIARDCLPIIYEILYSVFNIGFDTLSENEKNASNIDIAIEAFALTKQLLKKDPNATCKNLLSLFCLHLARREGKFAADQFVTFFDQDRSSWNDTLIQLGLSYLTKPEQLDRYYLEALITSMHMVTKNHDQVHWDTVSKCYGILEKVNDSPIIKINYAYALYKANQAAKAQVKLEEAKRELSATHFYLQIVEAEMLQKTNPNESKNLLLQALKNADQEWRKQLIETKIGRLFENKP